MEDDAMGLPSSFFVSMIRSQLPSRNPWRVDSGKEHVGMAGIPTEASILAMEE